MDNERVEALATLKRQVGFWITQGRALRAAINRSADAVAEAIGGGDVDASPKVDIDLTYGGISTRWVQFIGDDKDDRDRLSKAFLSRVEVVGPSYDPGTGLKDGVRLIVEFDLVGDMLRVGTRKGCSMDGKLLERAKHG